MSNVPATSPLVPGDPSEVDGYRVVGRLGEGGQGVVFLATSPDGEHVAIKQLRAGLVNDGTARSRLAKEVAAARQVAPFCTARVIDADLDGPTPHVVSEFIDGPSLQRRVQDDGPFAGAELFRLAVGTATALAAIHQAGVVHRDFKPANVMLADDGPRVIDFGIARDLTTETTVTSRVFGTPAYMAPEQVSGERATEATDVFAWGSTLVYAATARAPFDAPHMVAVVHRITSVEADLTGVPPALATVVRRCLAKNPADRPSAQQIVQLLLGHPLPSQDLSDPTAVLAEATQVAVSPVSQPPPVPVRAQVTVPRRPDQPTPQPVAGVAAWWAQPSQAPPSPRAPSGMAPRPPLPPVPEPRQPGRAGPVIAAVLVLVLAAGTVAGLLIYEDLAEPQRAVPAEHAAVHAPDDGAGRQRRHRARGRRRQQRQRQQREQQRQQQWQGQRGRRPHGPAPLRRGLGGRGPAAGRHGDGVDGAHRPRARRADRCVPDPGRTGWSAPAPSRSARRTRRSWCSTPRSPPRAPVPPAPSRAP